MFRGAAVRILVTRLYDKIFHPNEGLNELKDPEEYLKILKWHQENKDLEFMIKIYTDGACSGNPGIGGWGVVILENNKDDILLNGGNDNTTNNRMELQAAIEALKYFFKINKILCSLQIVNM